MYSAFGRLKLADTEILFKLLPDYFDIQKFTKIVDVPFEWEHRIELQEGYNKWAGFYDEEIEVAYPVSFRKHTFTFERPNLQAAVDLLDDMEKIHEAIQAYRSSRR